MRLIHGRYSHMDRPEKIDSSANGEVISLMKIAKATEMSSTKVPQALKQQEHLTMGFTVPHVKRYEIEGTKTIRGMSYAP